MNIEFLKKTSAFAAYKHANGMKKPNSQLGNEKKKRKKRKTLKSIGPTLENSLKKNQIKDVLTILPTIPKTGKKKPYKKAKDLKDKKDNSSCPRVENGIVTNESTEEPNLNFSSQEEFNLFEKLINPINVKQFFEEFWEKAPCFVAKNNPSLFSSIISFESIDQMLLNDHVEFTKNIDVTSYENGARKTLNPDGRALPSDVWSFYNDGCSIRILNPQTFLHNVHIMCATLQEYFHCMVGANVYLTPPNSQGFAPHYDDIEAFVLQIEGRKRWRLYSPRTDNEQLPRYSSENLDPNEIGSPIFDRVINPGDILYFPRGVIHQASTEPGYHSLHITLSVYQKQSYADLFETLLPMALSKMIEKNVNFRKGLPLNIWKNFGFSHSNKETNERKTIFKDCTNLLKQMLSEIPLDDAVDQVAKKFQHDALPPILSVYEKERTVFASKTSVDKEGNAIINKVISLETSVRLLRANIIRLVNEENTYRIYYYMDNSREYHEFEANFIEIEEESVPAVKNLIRCYPSYLQVKKLPLDDDEHKIAVVQSLWERGLLLTKKKPH